MDYGVRSRSNKRYVWNTHLMKEVESELHPDWVLSVVHGFVGQSNLSIFGRSVYITIVARRSNKYAGTRFLKRGANFEVNWEILFRFKTFTVGLFISG